MCREILAAAVQAGAQLAEPGEFTSRAFINGKLSLDQAEAVIDIIEAKSALAPPSNAPKSVVAAPAHPFPLDNPQPIPAEPAHQAKRRP